MLYKILFVAIIFYAFRMIYKSLNILKSIQENQKKQNDSSTSTSETKKKEDIIDAEFKEVDRDK